MDQDDAKGPEHSSHRRKKRRRYRLLRSLSVKVVFWSTVVVGLAGLALSYLGEWYFAGFGLLACLFAARVVYVNDKKGFSTRGDRRVRYRFTVVETLVIGMLVLANITMIAWALIA